MSNLQQKLDEIIEKRFEKKASIEQQITKWKAQLEKIESTIATVTVAENYNPEIAGATSKLQDVAGKLRGILAVAEKVRTRFSRKTLCIGIGGAARMGKSTFLQSVTGLADTQIPTSDKYYTTAISSQIEHSASENVAVADFHSVESFLRKAIAPLCEMIKVSVPTNLSEFRNATFEPAPDFYRTQEAEDIISRLKDAQKYLDTYEKYLTGERSKRIPLEELRPFVAYPDGGNVKAGPYLAVSDLVIRVKFPSTDVSHLRVIDLPGLGEAGVNIAKMQTECMADVCDVTFLVKRPTDANIQWTKTDTNAIDAMREAMPFLDDQTKFTAILANVGGADEERAELCVKAIRDALKRPFQIIRCNAVDRDSVTNETMPIILEFMAKNLPLIDQEVSARLEKEASLVFGSSQREIAEIAMRVRANAPVAESDYNLAQKISNRVMDALTKIENQSQDKAKGADEEWDKEVDSICANVKQWIEAGCGYGSAQEFRDAISKEINKRRGQPTDVINDCRVKFRAQWANMDLHLDSRIAALLIGIMDSMKEVLLGLVPERAKTDNLDDVRKQILDFADRIDERYSAPDEKEALGDLSRPLRRIAEFDLQFRFHLEPMLHAMTHLLVASELPVVSGVDDAEKFCTELKKKLNVAADEYASGMRKSGGDISDELERKKRLLEKSIPDPVTRDDIIAILKKSANAQSFCPNRIFAAVVETFADAFIRSKNVDHAFEVLAREWRSELTPAPDDKTRYLNAAAGVLNELAKHFQNSNQ